MNTRQSDQRFTIGLLSENSGYPTESLIAHDVQLVKQSDELWFSARYIVELSSQQGIVRKLLAKVKLIEDFKYIGIQLLSAYSLPKILKLVNDYCGWLQIPSHYLFRGAQDREELIFCSQQYSEVDPALTAQYAKRLITDIGAPYVIMEQEIRISCSIGIVQFPQDSENGSELLRIADTAMYWAKSHKNTFVFHRNIEQV